MPVVTDFINELQSPKTLFRHFHVTIGGGAGAAPPNGAASIRRFQVTDKLQSAQGFTSGLSGLVGKEKARPMVRVVVKSGIPVGNPNADEFDAFYIPMVNTVDVGNNASHYTLPTVLLAGQPNIMITSQLSGCTFGVGSDAIGATLITHVRPNQSLEKAQRQGDLDNTVGNSFQGNFGTFSRQNYAHYAAVIGRLSGGSWKFYLQANRTGQNANENQVHNQQRL